MKHHKPQGTASKGKKKASMKAFKKYIDNEVTLIHEDLEELKSFLAEHASMPATNELQADDKNLDEYYNSANDLFRQVALEADGSVPLEAKWYETFVLKKKQRNVSASTRKSIK
jgi:hypothetical protein